MATTQANSAEDRRQGWDYLIEFREPLAHDPAYIGTYRVTVFAGASHLAYTQAMRSCHAAHPNASELSMMEATRLDWRDTLIREGERQP